MKHKLLQAIAETRRHEAKLEVLCTDAPANPSGEWRPKDHLSHLAWLREREASVIDAVRTGNQPPPDLDDDQSTAIYAAMRDRTSTTVIANARRSWDILESAIVACTDDDLERPHPQRAGRKLVDGSPADHLAAHLMWCYLEAGDEKAAEAVQLWARDLTSRLFDEPRSRAVASYNLACFYARVRRADDALPLLRESLEAAPDLKEWSLKDPDLDPIREDPRVASLLGTTTRIQRSENRPSVRRSVRAARRTPAQGLGSPSEST